MQSSGGSLGLCPEPMLFANEKDRAVVEAINNCNSKKAAEEIDWIDALRALRKVKPRHLDAWVLHRCIEWNAPIDVIRVILELKPSTLTAKYMTQRLHLQTLQTPLSMACNLDDSEEGGVPPTIARLVLRKMVSLKHAKGTKQAYREFEEKNDQGLLHLVSLSHISYGKLNALLQEFPAGALAKYHGGETQINISLAAYCGMMVVPMKRNECYTEKAKLLLIAGSKGTVDGKVLRRNGAKMFYPHALLQSVFYHGPFALKKEAQLCDWVNQTQQEDRVIKTLQFLEAKDPGQIRQSDENGNLPLHLALANRKAGSNTKNDLYSAKLIKFLLEIHPEAASIRNKAGQLPLHIALDYAHPAYKLIVEASPSWAFEARCPTRRVYPFQLPTTFGVARVRKVSGGAPSKQNQLFFTEMSYNVLRKAPHMVASALIEDNNAWFDSDLFKEIQAKELQREQLAANIMVLKAKLEMMKETENDKSEKSGKAGKRKRDEG